MYQAPRGTQDILPDDLPYWHLVEAEARRQAALTNFLEIRTPTFEDTPVFLKGVGGTTDIVEHEMYTFQDKGGESLTLRPEGTAAVMRAYLQRGLSSRPQPVKLFSIMHNFRFARPQQGRLREFHVLNVEAIGEPDPMVDAELVGLQWRLYASLGLRQLSLQVNSIGDAACRPGYIQALRAYFEQHEAELCPDCRRRLTTNPLRLLDCKTPSCQPILNEAPHSADHLCGPCKEHFVHWLDYLETAGLPYNVNARMVRGLDYYTRSVWEVWPPDSGGQSTIGGGGRYDALAELLGGKPTPGVGFATGIERIIIALKDQGVPAAPSSGPCVYLTYQTEGGKTAAFRLAESLRAEGISAELAFGKRQLKKQFAAADRAGAQIALVLGEDELASDAVTLKDLRNGEQRTIDQTDVVSVLRREHGATD
jgi:histidyl-tRNA synthetase